MIKVFVSCASQDRERIRPLIRALVSNSWKILVDKPATGDRAGEPAARAVIDQADCIVVVWSAHAIHSRRVISIADRAREANRLVPVLIEKVEPPLRFRIIQTHDLSHADRARLSVELHNLKTSILRFLPKTPLPSHAAPADPGACVAQTGAGAGAAAPQGRSSTPGPAPGDAAARGSRWFGNPGLLVFRIVAVCLMLAGSVYVWQQYNIVMQQQREVAGTGAQPVGPGPAPAAESGQSSTPAPAPPHGGTHIYLTARESNGIPLNQPGNQFSCTDKIFAVIEVSALPSRQHHLVAIWRDPHGKDRELTRYPFYAAGPANRIWVWLKLHRPPEAALVRFVNPSAGMEEFIGEWELRVTLNGELLGKKPFNVLC